MGLKDTIDCILPPGKFGFVGTLSLKRTLGWSSNLYGDRSSDLPMLLRVPNPYLI